jgi:hypothetical protein
MAKSQLGYSNVKRLEIFFYVEKIVDIEEACFYIAILYPKT